MASWSRGMQQMREKIVTVKSLIRVQPAFRSSPLTLDNTVGSIVQNCAKNKM